jgi:hypothetical protein
MVDPVEDEYRHGAQPGADAAAYLARHGVKLTVDRLPSLDYSVADVLRRHAVDVAAQPDGDGRLWSFPVARAHLRWRHHLDA